MNRKQLERMHELGLVSDVQYTAGVAQLNAGREFSPRLSVNVPGVATLSVDASSRTISGVASIYDELIPSHGFVLDAGSLTSRTPLNKNKMLVDHDKGQPVGYLSALNEDSLEVTYTIPEGPAGDAALDSAAKGLRDGLSAGFTITEYYFDAEYVMHVTGADWYETSLVACPALADAGVTDVAAAVATEPTQPKGNHTVNRAQLAAALAAGTISQEQHDAALAAIDATEATLATAPNAPAPGAAPVDAALAAGPQHEPAPAANLEISTRPVNLATVAQRIADGVRSRELTTVDAIALAIGEFVPSQDAGEAWTRPEWLGELRTMTNTRRPYIEAIGNPLPLASLKAEGYRWTEEPDVDEHTLDTIETVDGNNPKTAGDAFKAFMVASAHRVHRSVVDFGDPQFTVDFLAARMRRYNLKSDIGIRTRLLAAATDPTAGAGGVPTVAAGGVVAVLKQLVRDVRPYGGKLNRVFLDTLLYEELEDLDVGPTSTLPLWLRQAVLSLDIAAGTADVGPGLHIELDPGLDAGEAVGFDNAFVDVRESPTLQPTAVAISVAAIDFGLFGYLRLDDHDPRAIVKRTYVGA